MKYPNSRRGIITLLIAVAMLFQVKANDVELRVPKSSIQNALDAFIHARYLSFGSETDMVLIDYYNVKVIDSDLTFFTNNRFELEVRFKAYVNFDLVLFEYDHDYGTKTLTIEGDIDIQATGNGYKLILDPTSIDFDDGNSLIEQALNLVSFGIVPRLPEISTSVKLPFLVNTATSYFTSATPTLTTTADMVTVGYTLKPGSRYVTVRNLVNGNDKVGNIQVVNGGSTSTYSSPRLFEWSSGSSRIVQTPDDLLDETNGKNKYRHWLNQDLEAQSDIATRRIQFAVTSSYETVTAKFDPANHIQLENNLEGGAAIGGTVTYDGNTTSNYDGYDFNDPTLEKAINTSVPNGTQGTNWFFWKWSDGNTNPQRNIIINQDHDLEALYKGSQISNNANTFKASQRKVVRTSDGWEHMVYESMGHIWYEAKAPGGDWEFVEGPGGIHMGDGAKSPSIAVKTTTTAWPWQYMTAAVWQEGTKIRVQTFRYDSGSGTFIDAAPYEFISTGQSSSYNTQPNVLWTDNEELIVLYRTSSGINYSVWAFHPTLFQLGEVASGTISGTSGAVNITAAVDSYQNNHYMGLAWEKDMGISGPPYYYGTEIKFASFIYLSGSSSVTVTVPARRISNGSVVRNKEPSIIVNEGTGKFVVGWISGVTTNSSWGSPYDTKATVATIIACPWVVCTSRSNLDHHVRSVSVSKLLNDSEFYVGWSQIYNQTGYLDYNKFVEGSALSTFKTLNTKGWNLQLTSATSDNGIRALSFYPKTQPYYWLESNSLGSYLKRSPLIATQSRGLMLSDPDLEVGVSYRIGEFYVNGEPISFKPLVQPQASMEELLSQETSANSFAPLDTVLAGFTTLPFTLNGGDEVMFDESFSFGDSTKVTEFLKETGSIVIKTLLVEHETGKELAVVRKKVLSVEQDLVQEQASWKVNTDEFAGYTVRAQLFVETDYPGLRGEIENSFSDDYALGKVIGKEYSELVLESQEVPETYALSQNYPNPFNPTTQIAYQIPEAGMVRLEVYDLLGRKVRTLVNEHKDTGTYSVTFNAADLASGMYVYTLTSGAFTTSQKMFLIK